MRQRGLVDDLNRGRTHHRDLADGLTVDPVGIAIDSAQKHICKILLLVLVGFFINEGNHTPGTARFVVGVRARQYGR